MIRTQIVEAIILSQRDFGEADRLYTVFTKQLGKITVLGKGVRRITSRRAGNLDVLNYATLHLAKGQTFWLVTEAQVINSFQSIKNNLTKTLYAYYLVEIVNELLPEGQENFQIFYTLKETLELFAQKARRLSIVGFEIKVLQLLGYWNIETLSSAGADVVALAKVCAVQSLKIVSGMDVNEHTFLALAGAVRNQLLDVAERKFKTPEILAKLRSEVEKAEHHD